MNENTAIIILEKRKTEIGYRTKEIESQMKKLIKDRLILESESKSLQEEFQALTTAITRLH